MLNYTIFFNLYNFKVIKFGNLFSLLYLYNFLIIFFLYEIITLNHLEPKYFILYYK